MSMEQVSLLDCDDPFQSNYDTASFLHCSETVQIESNRSQEYVNLTTYENSIESKYEGMSKKEGGEPIQPETYRLNEQITGYDQNVTTQSSNDRVTVLDNESCYVTL